VATVALAAKHARIAWADGLNGGSNTGDLMRHLRAHVIRARTDGCIKGRIYLTQSDPEFRRRDALATQGESIYSVQVRKPSKTLI